MPVVWQGPQRPPPKPACAASKKKKPTKSPSSSNLLPNWDCPIADALHCQKKPGNALMHDCHLLVQAKDNQPFLLKACRLIAAHQPAKDAVAESGKGHGRIEGCNNQVFGSPKIWWPVVWAALTACLVQVTRSTSRRGSGGVWKTAGETAFYACTVLLPATIPAGAIRRHWASNIDCTMYVISVFGKTTAVSGIIRAHWRDCAPLPITLFNIITSPI